MKGFPLPQLLVCACCVLLHVVFSILQSPVWLAAVSSRGFNNVVQLVLPASAEGCKHTERPFFFEMDSGFLTKFLCFCAAEWFSGCEGWMSAQRCLTAAGPGHTDLLFWAPSIMFVWWNWSQNVQLFAFHFAGKGLKGKYLMSWERQEYSTFLLI